MSQTVLAIFQRPDYSCFFHRFAIARKKKNEIVKLKDDLRTWCTWNHDLQNLIVDYFNDIFTTRGSDSD